MTSTSGNQRKRKQQRQRQKRQQLKQPKRQKRKYNPYKQLTHNQKEVASRLIDGEVTMLSHARLRTQSGRLVALT